MKTKYIWMAMTVWCALGWGMEHKVLKQTRAVLHLYELDERFRESARKDRLSAAKEKIFIKNGTVSNLDTAISVPTGQNPVK